MPRSLYLSEDSNALAYISVGAVRAGGEGGRAGATIEHYGYRVGAAIERGVVVVGSGTVGRWGRKGGGCGGGGVWVWGRGGGRCVGGVGGEGGAGGGDGTVRAAGALGAR